MAQNRSFYLPDDVLEYLSQHENASAAVTRLVRWQIARDVEAAAYQRAHGTPLTDERRERARAWARDRLAEAAARTEATAAERAELRRRLGRAA